MNPFYNLNRGQLKQVYSNAYKTSDIQTIKKVLEFIDENSPKELLSYLNNAFLYACMNGNLSLVKFYLTSPELKMHANINAGAGPAEPIRQACRKGQLEIIKYLLHSSDLKEHAYLDSKGFPFISACETNQLEVVKYFLNKPEFKEKINTDIIKTAIRFSCRSSEKDVFKYLLESTNIKSENDYGSLIDEAFGLALEHKNNELARYMVFDLEIEKNSSIEKSLKQHKNPEVENWFDLKKMNAELSAELIGNESKNKRTKI